MSFEIVIRYVESTSIIREEFLLSSTYSLTGYLNAAKICACCDLF